MHEFLDKLKDNYAEEQILVFDKTHEKIEEHSHGKDSTRELRNVSAWNTRDP